MRTIARCKDCTFSSSVKSLIDGHRATTDHVMEYGSLPEDKYQGEPFQ